MNTDESPPEGGPYSVAGKNERYITRVELAQTMGVSVARIDRLVAMRAHPALPDVRTRVLEVIPVFK